MSSPLPRMPQQPGIRVGPAGAIHERGESSTGSMESPCCIFKIPSFLMRNKHNAYGYQPTVVSIGPYHHGTEGLEGIQTLKEEFKKLFKRQAKVQERVLYDAVKFELSDIRRSYSDPSGLGDEESAIKMMVLDGCFLLVLFLTSAGKFKINDDSSLFNTSWVLPSIRRDLLLIGNQIPMLVLEVLLGKAKFAATESVDLKYIALKFFSPSFKYREGFWANTNKDLEAKHLLALIRNTFILKQPHAEVGVPAGAPAGVEAGAEAGIEAGAEAGIEAGAEARVEAGAEAGIEAGAEAGIEAGAEAGIEAEASARVEAEASARVEAGAETRAHGDLFSSFFHLIGIVLKRITTQKRAHGIIPIQANDAPNAPPHTKSVRLTLPANKLRSRGMKFKPRKNGKTFLDISFENGVLLIPEIILDDFLTVVMLNCIAFEHFYANASTDITSYAMFMGCLVNSKRDVAYLVEKGIIQNYLGTDDEVSRFFKRILNDYVFDIDKSYLRVTIEDVEEYSSNRCNVRWATFKQAYVGSLWIFISKLAAFALLLLTIAQVVLAAIALKSNPRSPQVIVMGNSG